VIEEDADRWADRSPSQRRILAVLSRAAATETRERTVRQIGDALAKDGLGPPLKKRTIQDALTELIEDGLADGETSPGVRGRYWVVR
jgi:hypothetical protein